MNSTRNNLTIATIDSIIQETYETNISLWFVIGFSTMLVYAALLKLPQEIDCIWLRPFSLPTFLYIIARYAPLIDQGLNILLSLGGIPALSEGKTCNILVNVENWMSFLSFIGIQGLLTARGYSICQGDKKLAIALVFSFVLGSIWNLYRLIAYPNRLCDTTSYGTIAYVSILITDISVILTDFLVFGICMWKVWRLWKLKKAAGIRSGRDLISVLLTQSILRCCFVVLISVTNSVTSTLLVTSNPPFTISIAGHTFSTFQNYLSAILVADFTLDLRRLNSAKIEASQVSLPTLQISNVLQRTHRSLLVEFCTPEDINMTNLGEDNDYDHDNFESVSAGDIQPAQE